jgi:hypothetical protein
MLYRISKRPSIKHKTQELKKKTQLLLFFWNIHCQRWAGLLLLCWAHNKI